MLPGNSRFRQPLDTRKEATFATWTDTCDLFANQQVVQSPHEAAVENVVAMTKPPPVIRRSWTSQNWLSLAFALVVLAVAAAVLYPVFQASKAAGDRPVCISNVKRTGLSLIIYSTDFDDRFPLRDFWMDASTSYRANPSILHCPRVVNERESRGLYGYAFNRVLSAAKIPFDPGPVPLVFDSVNLARNASSSLDSLPNPGRHSGNMNVVGYADGSAKTTTFSSADHER